jgi:hypothetical protein
MSNVRIATSVSTVVSITPATGWFTDAGLTQSVTFPTTISAATVFYSAAGGRCTVSAVAGGKDWGGQVLLGPDSVGRIEVTPQANGAGGLSALRPTAAEHGRGLFFNTDTRSLDYSDGSSWTSGVGGGSGALPGLSVGGKGPVNIPVGLRAHAAFDIVSNGTDQAIGFRFGVPITDPTVDAILPAFTNQGVSTASGAPDTDAPNAITIACSVETSDGVNVPGTFNGGAHTVSIPAAGSALVFPDSPLAFGAQVALTDKFSVASPLNGTIMRTYAQTPGPALTSSTGTTAVGSPTVTDAAASASWLGRRVSGTGIPSNPTYVGTVAAGVSYTLSSTPITQAITAVNATAAGTPTITFGQYLPFNITPEYSVDAASLNNAADPTLYGAAAPSGGAYSAYYGPSLILGRSTSAQADRAVARRQHLRRLQRGLPLQLPGPDPAGVPRQRVPDGEAEPRRRDVAVVQHPVDPPVPRAADGRLHPRDRGVRHQRRHQLGHAGDEHHRPPGVDRHLPEHAGHQGVDHDDPAAHLLHRRVGHGRQPDRRVPHREPRDHQPGGPRPHLRPVVYQGVIDMEGACSSAQDSGKWGTSKTGDGVHPSDAVMRGAIQTLVNNVVSTWSV